MSLLRNSDASQWYQITDTREEAKFLAAVQNDQVDKAIAMSHRGCCSAGVDMDCFDQNGDSALHIAVTNRNLQMVSALLNSSASIDLQRSFDGNTALHLASRADCIDILECLMANGASRTVPNDDGHFPIAVAAAIGPAATVISLLAAGSGSSTVNSGCINMLSTESGWTALHCAAFGGFEENVTQLLQYNADPSLPDNSGMLALHHSAALGHVETLEALLFSKENTHQRLINQPTGQQLTALHLASIGGFEATMKILLETKADPNAVDSLKQTVLHKAVNTSSDAHGMVKLLLAHDADVNVQDVHIKTPLSYVLAREAASMPSSREGIDLSAVKALLQPSEGSEPAPMHDVGRSLHGGLRKSKGRGSSKNEARWCCCSSSR